MLLPLLLSLGMNYAWLDIDIFVVQNPTSRLLQLADVLSADVLTTDHFDETCLNHGATCHDLPVLVILVCFVAMLSLIVQLCFAAMLCFRILFATIIPFNALTRPAVVATVAHGAWCRILGLWEVLLQQTRYVCGMMSWQSSP